MNEEPIKVASCVILDDYGRILMQHNATETKQWWENPGGKVEEGESVEAAGRREIAEELGVAIDIVRRLGKTEIELNDKLYELHWLQAVITHGEPKIMEPQTFDDLDFFEIEDMPSLSLSPGTLELLNQIVSGEVQL